MITISEDNIRIEGPNGKFTFAALGGPEDPISLIGQGESELAASEWNELQLAFVNFFNSGYFNQEI